MGGFGSGQRWSRKGTVEQCYSIDTADLNRWKVLVSGTTSRGGSFSWGRGGQSNAASVSYLLTVGSNAGTLRLMYSVGAPKTECGYRIRLETTACRLGGRRWWFRCPLSKNGVGGGRRVRKLYLCGKYFGCRHCHNLTYRSRQESDARVYALARTGLDAMPDINGASLTQLGLALKALNLMQKRAKRFDG